MGVYIFFGGLRDFDKIGLPWSRKRSAKSKSLPKLEKTPWSRKTIEWKMKKLPLPLKVKRAKKFEIDLDFGVWSFFCYRELDIGNSNFRKSFTKVKKSLGLKNTPNKIFKIHLYCKNDGARILKSSIWSSKSHHEKNATWSSKVSPWAKVAKTL